jgi:hypothetical protein
LGRDAVEITLSELVRRVRRRLSEEEAASSGYFKRKWTQTTEHTGELELRLTSATAKDVPSTLSDEGDNRLETRMVEFLAAILAAAAYVRARREEYEAEQRRRREQEEEERRREAEWRAERTRAGPAPARRGLAHGHSRARLCRRGADSGRERWHRSCAGCA